MHYLLAHAELSLESVANVVVLFLSMVMTVLAFLLARHKTRDERKGWIYLGIMMALSASKMLRPVVDPAHGHDFSDTMVSLVAFVAAVMGCEEASS